MTPSTPTRAINGAERSPTTGIHGMLVDLYFRARPVLGLIAILAPLVTLAVGFGHPSALLISGAGAVLAAHGLWARHRPHRSLVTTSLFDITVFNTALAAYEGINPGATGAAVVLALECVILTLVLGGLPRLVLLGYAGAWYLVSEIAGASSTGSVVRHSVTVAAAMTALVVVLSRVRAKLILIEAERAHLLGVVSHELRNNLTSVVGVTGMNDDRLPREELTELMGMAHQSASDAVELVEDLVTLSRMERSELTVSCEPLDVVAEMKALQSRCGDTEKLVKLEADEPSMLALADPLRYRQIFRNLCTNAVRYGGDTIVVRLMRSGDEIHTQVTDDGEGVSTDEVPRLFSAYHQDTKRGGAPGSVGLGLWISRQLALAMGGDLHYRRDDGWTVFDLALPAA